MLILLGVVRRLRLIQVRIRVRGRAIELVQLGAVPLQFAFLLELLLLQPRDAPKQR